MNLSVSGVLASIVWGSIGLGFFVYGKKQKSAVPLFGGLALMGMTYFIDSALILSMAACAVVAGMVYLARR